MRYIQRISLSGLPDWSPIQCATAIRQTFRGGYSLASLRRDVVAGVVVGVVALPLSMALAIASGAPPQHGLFTAIVGGFIIALLGGSFTSVSGPTAAFVVLLAPITAKFGLAGLMIASLMAGAILVLMGVARLGKLLRFIPHPVTTGFTAGIAVSIAALQLKDFMGLQLDHRPEHFPELVFAMARALPTLHWTDFGIGLFTLALLIVWPKFTKRVPAALVALTLGAVLAWGLGLFFPSFHVDTIASRFSYLMDGQTFPGIPRSFPRLVLPWNVVDAATNHNSFSFSIEQIRDLAIPALAIAMLGAIESLLCAVVADGMAGTKHDPDAELIGQGIGNLVTPFFGGIAATAAIARTATNIRAGGRTPVAALVHALFVLAAMLSLAPLLGQMPMASLAALLLIVAWNMSDLRHFTHIVRVAPRSDVVVLLACFSMMVLFDMVVAVGVGVTLAALLFMRRMAELTSAKLTDGDHPHLLAPLPPDVLLYEIAGPLFFGAAEKAGNALSLATGRPSAVIFWLGAVPTMDITGLVALESAIRKFQAMGAMVVLTDIQPEPAALLSRAEIKDDPGRLAICHSLQEAEMLVRLVDPRIVPDQSKPTAA
ncbi:MAG: C4-dicarboxylic acid transporter DauA [Phycisphaeraceae bacterium]|nr:C4-dicarboxylic acid transporter DauA [Phycisphaeraceae bacterium]